MAFTQNIFIVKNIVFFEKYYFSINNIFYKNYGNECHGEKKYHYA